jgi:hypothetical protein
MTNSFRRRLKRAPKGAGVVTRDGWTHFSAETEDELFDQMADFAVNMVERSELVAKVVPILRDRDWPLERRRRIAMALGFHRY